jgi:hypothetical protein
MSKTGPTRHIENVGNPEQITFGSNQGAVTGCVGSSCGGPGVNIARAGYPGLLHGTIPGAHTNGGKMQKGGNYVKPVFNDDIPMGRSGALIGHKSATNCGMNSDLNMGASKQYSNPSLQKGGSGYGRVAEGNVRYGFDPAKGADLGDLRGSYAPITASSVESCAVIPPRAVADAAKMSGGGIGKVCHDLKKVKHYGHVKSFWARVCPGAVMLYETHLQKMLKKDTANVNKVVKLYTKALCHYVKAVGAKGHKVIKRELASMKRTFGSAEKVLHKLTPKAHKMHVMVVNKHVYDIERLLSGKHSTRKGRQGKKNMGTRRRRHGRRGKRKTGKRKNKSGRKRRRTTMKGGYHQFNSNVPISNTYKLVPSGTSNLNEPPTYQKTNQCQDNYNHYTGKTMETGVYDKDI